MVVMRKPVSTLSTKGLLEFLLVASMGLGPKL